MRVLTVPPEKHQFLHLDANTGTSKDSIYPQGGRDCPCLPSKQPQQVFVQPGLARGSSHTTRAAAMNDKR